MNRNMWLSLLSVFVASSCDVVHNDDGICKITSPMFCFLVDRLESELFQIPIHEITSTRKWYQDVAIIGRRKSIDHMQDKGRLSLISGYALFKYTSSRFSFHKDGRLWLIELVKPRVRRFSHETEYKKYSFWKIDAFSQSITKFLLIYFSGQFYVLKNSPPPIL